jgi:predicted phosphoribosyltransferase
MSEKILIGIANATGENVLTELLGSELTSFNADRADFDKAVKDKEQELKSKREAVKTKLNALGLSDEDLILLGLIPKAEQSTPAQPGGN